MPPRACIICSRPAIPGASRCRTHGGRVRTTKSIRFHDSRQTQWAKNVLARARDNGRWYCHVCGYPPTHADPLEAGHIIPLALGGTYTLTNGQPEHRSCNRRQGTTIAKTRRAWIG